MSIVVIGGIDRLKRHYERTLKEKGYATKIFLQNLHDLQSRLGCTNGIIVFTNQVSHNAMWCVTRHAKIFNIPIARSRTSSISGLKRCINVIENRHKSSKAYLVLEQCIKT